MGISNSLTSITNAVSTATSTAAQAVSSASSLATTLSGNSWSESLRTAQIAGVPFAVESVRTSVGRRVTVHSYPYRDTVWVEDMGKLPRQFAISGFLVEDSVLYSGGAVVTQRNNLITALEKAPDAKTPGVTLIHPTLGEVTNCFAVGPIEFNERTDLGRCFEFKVTLIISGARVFPTTATSTTDATPEAAKTALQKAIDTFTSAVASVAKVTSAITTAVSTAEKWVAIAETAVSDVKSIYNAVTTLAGSLGRYTSGSNSGYSASNTSTTVTSTTLSSAVSTALSDALTARTAVTTAASTTTTATSSMESDMTTFTDSVSSLVSAVAATANDPADAMRLMESLADFSPDDYTSDSVLGTDRATMQTALSALFRRAALTQLATESASYQPSSSNDAQTVLATVTGLFDDEILIAGDAGDDDVYMAFRAMRQAVVSDFNARGSQLSAIKTWDIGGALPSLTAAQKIYQDPTRADELVTQADPIHPAFMPSSFDALAT